MFKSAVTRTYILAFILMFFAQGYAVAQNKVVVVPLGGTESTLDIYYGSVTGSGSLETGNLASSTRISEGSYTITIGRSVSGCSGTASTGYQGSGTFDTVGTVSVGIGIPVNEIRVLNKRYNNFTDSFQSNDTDFHITIICPKT